MLPQGNASQSLGLQIGEDLHRALNDVLTNLGNFLRCEMKKTSVLALTFSLVAMSAAAGGKYGKMAEPVVEVPVVPVAGSSTGNIGWKVIPPVILVCALLCDGTTTTTTTTGN